MSKGGFRPGSGRPKGAKNIKPAPKIDVAKDIARAAKESGMSPLDYMLNVMRDENADGNRRDRMAVAAAPFVHARAEPVDTSKKAQKQANAEKAATQGRFAPRPGPRLAINNG